MAGVAIDDKKTLDQIKAAWDQLTLRAKLLSEARESLAEGRGFSAQQVKEMTDDEAVARYIAIRQREVRDAAFKASYLPYREAVGSPMLAAAEKFVDDAVEGPLGVFAAIMPGVQSSLRSTMKLDRRVAALRTVEALRLHAAVNGGALPERLEDVQVVPVPFDPATGKPFQYEREDAAALILGGRADGQAKSEVGYRVRVRP
jgi:hypothetical protein